MKEKIIFTIFTFLTVTVLFLAYDMIQKRYFSEEAVEEQTSLFEEIKKEWSEKPETASFDSGIAGGNSQGTLKGAVGLGKNGQARINKTDCGNNCEKFHDNKENFKYCKKLCGFSPVAKKEYRAECGSLGSTEKDSCLRDLAVAKKDFKICDEINNKKIKDTCNDRIIDDIFEEK